MQENWQQNTGYSESRVRQILAQEKKSKLQKSYQLQVVGTQKISE